MNVHSTLAGGVPISHVHKKKMQESSPMPMPARMHVKRAVLNISVTLLQQQETVTEVSNHIEFPCSSSGCCGVCEAADNEGRIRTRTEWDWNDCVLSECVSPQNLSVREDLISGKVADITDAPSRRQYIPKLGNPFDVTGNLIWPGSSSSQLCQVIDVCQHSRDQGCQSQRPYDSYEASRGAARSIR